MTPIAVSDGSAHVSLQTLCSRNPSILAACIREVEIRVEEAITRYAPTHAVLGIHRRESRDHPALRAAAREILARHAIPVVERHIDDARTFLVGRVRGRVLDDLPATLVRDYFPGLSSRLDVDANPRRHKRHAWNALALALLVLAEQRPVSVLALLQPGVTLSPALHQLLTHAAKDFRG